MRRSIPVALVIVTCVAPVRADGPSPPLLLADPSRATDFCFFDNAIYSIGATMCIKKQGVVCVPAISTEDGKARSCEQGKVCPEGLGGRAYWSSRTVASPGGGKEDQPIIWVPPTISDCQ